MCFGKKIDTFSWNSLDKETKSWYLAWFTEGIDRTHHVVGVGLGWMLPGGKACTGGVVEGLDWRYIEHRESADEGCCNYDIASPDNRS